MTEEEFKILLEFFTNEFNRMELGWVIDQLNDLINEGKYEIQKIQTYKEVDTNNMLPGLERGQGKRVQKSGQAQMTVHTEFTPEEKLEILLSLVEQVLVNSVEMEIHLQELFEISDENNELLPNNKVIVFRTEDTGSPIEHVFDPSSARSKVDGINKLKTILDEIRRNK